MVLNLLDWSIVVVFFILLIWIGLKTAKKGGQNSAEFFLSGRNMPWWLLGTSMVATTFSCDTPNLVTDIVRQNGVAGNWLWWAFLLTGMLTVFVYARLWSRSKVFTDLEFYELRYSGKMAAFLRGFRAIYLGAFFNIMVIASVSIALIKIGAVMFGWSPFQILLLSSVIVVFYSAIGGLTSILYTDFFQFILAMIGAIGAAIVIISNQGGLSEVMQHEAVIPKLDLIPDFSNTDALYALFIIPLAVQWWSVWYPGSEPGGGGYIAQRMLAAKDEKNALSATLLFNVFHYALRPWPWILVALASLIVFPDIASLQAAFPNVDPQYIHHDMAYPAMLSMLPHGLLGLIVASLIAAFMSTASTQINWGASYLVHDFYLRFIKPKATDRELVLAGRIITVLLMAFALGFALLLQNALQAFNILLQIGAGTGLIFILRWFWWRINAYTEFTGMVVSFAVAFTFLLLERFGGYTFTDTFKMLLGIGITTIAWVTVTFLTPATDKEVLKNFYKKTQPGGPGWAAIRREIGDAEIDKKAWEVPRGMLGMLYGTIAVYSTIFGVGFLLYGEMLSGALFIAIALSFYYLVWRIIRK